MRWTFFFVMPAVVSFFWPLMTLMRKRQVLTAQWIMLATQVLTGLAIFFYMGEIAARYIYNCIFVSLAALCVPMYYMFVCSLTSPEGIKREDRWAFIPSFLFLLMYFILVFILRTDRFQLYMDNVVGLGNTDLRPSKAYSLMVFVGYYGFPLFMAVQSLVLFVVGLVKLHRYHSLIAYVEGKNLAEVRKMDRPVVIFTYSVVPVALVFVLVPQHILTSSPYIVIPLAVVVSVLQFLVGFYAYRLNYSAEQLAKNSQKS